MTQSRIRITHMGVAILLALSVGAPWAFSNEDCDICQEDYEEWCRFRLILNTHSG